MPEHGRATAARRFDRIVHLVAHASRGPEEGIPLADLARTFGTTVAQITQDLRTLTLLDDNSAADWLLSLSVWQEEDRVRVKSMGPYRRPVRFTPDELLALKVALATEPNAEGMATRFAGTDDDRTAPPNVALDGRIPADERILGQLREAIRSRRLLEIRYVSAGDRVGTDRLVEPHQLVGHAGKYYCVAWCRRAEAWRHFRTDRIIDALPASDEFTPRDDFEPPADGTGVFHPPAEVDEVTVRFSDQVARWIREHHPDASDDGNGGVLVRYQVASVDWLVRHVLQYGAEAEVVSPDEYREAVRRAVEQVA